jgi:outer membrane lipoprotein carrier protein
MFPASSRSAATVQRLLPALIILLLAWIPAPAGDDKPAISLVSSLQKHLRGLTDFRASFTQGLKAPHSSTVREESGVLYVRMPGKMRWNYLEPERKEFICDGEKIWFYEPEENAVTIYAAGSVMESGTPLQLLLGQGDLLEDFLVSADDTMLPLSPANRMALIEPREGDAAFIRAHLEMTTSATPRLVRLLVVDPLQNVTEYRFSNFIENSGLAEDYFRFEVPPGTEVWEERVTPPPAAQDGSSAISN